MAPEPRGVAALGALWERASLLDLEPIAQRRKAGTVEPPKERGDPVVVEGSFPLPDPTVELILLAGKGGVGKTTLACATALAMASLRPNESTLLLSTDPAHSLADALAHKVGDHPVPIRENLFALELDASRRLEHLRKGYTKDLEHFLSTVFKELDPVFDRKVLEKLIDLAPPGVDEVMALAEMADLLADRK